MTMHLVLGSASPARFQTLTNAGLSVIRWPADTDEDQIYRSLWPEQDPQVVVTTLARGKTRTVSQQILEAWQFLQSEKLDLNAGKDTASAHSYSREQREFLEQLHVGDQILVLGADSMLLLNGNLQGKPHTAERARAQIDRLANQSPVLYSGHCLQLIALQENHQLSPSPASSAAPLSPTISTADPTIQSAPSAVAAIHPSDPIFPPVALTPYDQLFDATTAVSKYFWLSPSMPEPKSYFLPATIPINSTSSEVTENPDVLVHPDNPTRSNAWTNPLSLTITEALGCSCSTVHFGPISAAEAEAYVATKEPLKVAGGFTIDGRGSAFIQGISGDYHSIVGISMPLLRILCQQLGVFWPAFWG